jgi:hypothetical protein
MRVEAKLDEMGVELPAPMWLPDAHQPTWRQVRVIGTRAVLAGHGPRSVDGTPRGPGGKVGSDLSVEEGYDAARSTALAVLGDLKREIADLDRVSLWVRVFGMVNSAPGFIGQAQVIDGFTELMVALYGDDAAICPRAVAGMAELPFGSPVIIEGEVELHPDR